MSVSVADVLKAASEEEAINEANIKVDRPLEQDIDAGNLLGREENDLPSVADEDCLYELARDNAQLLINAIFALPTDKVEDVLCAKLPQPTLVLPREKPAPKPKPLTKWEEYAKSKGIVKNKNKGAGKNPRTHWDDTVQEWIPTYGYKKAKADEKKTWMMEAKGNADPMEDPFEKAIQEKQERVAKNEMQRLRNIARAKKVNVPGVGLAPSAEGSRVKQSKTELEKAAELAKKSTASLGKFQGKLADSKLEQKAASTKVKGAKRKFDPLVSQDGSEKARNMKVLDSLMNKKPKLDLNKAVGHHLHQEDSNRKAEKAGRKPGAGKKGGKRAGKSHFKNRGGGKAKGGKTKTKR